MKSHTTTGQRLMDMFHILLDHYGPRHWWPAETPLEMMIGAVLTQNTNWKNVERAIQNLKKKDLISIARLHRLPLAELAQEIRPAGYYNIKAKRLKNLIEFMANHCDGDMDALLSRDAQALREGLLSVKGIGPETADSIVLYAAHQPVFVIDAYTYRILNRHGMAEDQATYDELQELFMDNLPEDPALFNEFHALIVETGKDFCRKKPRCELCPLNSWGPTRPVID
jgi:endonuclease-3 related protein